jgi:acyl-CoA synthetase (AMP-forming)/AMP-acid ligase II
MATFTGRQYVTPAYPVTVWALVEQAVRDRPDAVVLADDHDRSLTTVQLRSAALEAAAGLQALGIGPGSRVSWQLPTTLEALVLKLALARLGAVQNPIIPILRDAEVPFITRQIESEFLVVPEDWAGYSHGGLARRLAEEQGLKTLILDFGSVPGSELRLPSGDPGRLPPPPEAGDAIRWLYFSSGTTSAPKGIRHTDASVMASASGVIGQLGAEPTDINPLAFPVTHIGGITMLSASLLTGMQLLLFDTFDPATTAERMAARGVTLLGSAVPFYMVFMAAQRRHGSAPLFPRLRACLGGGAPVPAGVNDSVRDVLGTSGIANAWGLTEFPVAASPRPDDPPAWLDHTAGQPVPGVTVRVVDEGERELEAEQEGELRLKGPQCFAGYLDPALDADAFDDEGWFRTGDLGLVDGDGNVRITGRLKDLIIRNAENISAVEVEEVLFGHPGVADVAVIGVPDERTGERVCAVVVAADDPPSLEELRAHCGRLGLARQKAPERLELVSDLPRNALGKVLKNELRAQYR